MPDAPDELELVAEEVKRRCLELLQSGEEARVEVRVNRRARKPLVVRVFLPKSA
jgi:hypothetical protein